MTTGTQIKLSIRKNCYHRAVGANDIAYTGLQEEWWEGNKLNTRREDYASVNKNETTHIIDHHHTELTTFSSCVQWRNSTLSNHISHRD